MKKNKMMRVASGLMVAVLMTTSAISGTFAKYVTQTSANDSARVAKFGVTLGTSGALFANSYTSTEDEAVGASISTTVSSDTKVVAPGTSSADVSTGTGMVFSISGTPEVAVKVSFHVATGTEENAWSDIVMPVANGYTDYTVYPTGSFNVTTPYYPLLFTLSDKNGDAVKTDPSDDNSALSDVNLEQIVNYLNSTDSDLYFDVGDTDLSTRFGSYTLTWRWPYESEHDKEDTFLGQYVATDLGVTTPAAATSGFSSNVSIKITMTVTQVD